MVPDATVTESTTCVIGSASANVPVTDLIVTLEVPASQAVTVPDAPDPLVICSANWNVPVSYTHLTLPTKA